MSAAQGRASSAAALEGDADAGPVRMTREKREAADGRREVVIRVLLEDPGSDNDRVEVAATVRVPAIDSDEQMEAAARLLARRALERAISAFPA